MVSVHQERRDFTLFRLKRCVLGVMVVLFLIFNEIRPGSCQGEISLQVMSPDATNFPVISLMFELDGLVEEDPGWLEADQVQVVEAGQPVPVLSLTQDQKGIYFSLAINGGRDLDIRDPSGLSVFDKLRDVLVDWAAGRSSAQEDAWSLITSEGPQVTHLPDAEEWISALKNYQPDFRNMTPQLTSLETALAVAQERVVPFGVDKALLYITPPPTPEQILSLNDLALQASKEGIIINVWMIGDAYFLTNQQGDALINLASATGGDFFHYTGTDPIPDPETYISSLSLVYTLAYASSITEAGTYPVEINVNIAGDTISGKSAPFYIDVQPPKPVLLTSASVITRRPESSSETNQSGYFPDTHPIEFMVEFPDGYEREIVVSRLYVDERLADIRSEPPFNVLSWRLIGLISSGTSTVQVEVEDSLGLIGRTIKIPVEIEVIQPTPEPDNSGLKIGWWIIGGLVVSALVLFLVWLLRRLWQRKKTQPARRIDTKGMHIDLRDKSASRVRQWEARAALLPLGMLEEDWETSAHFITQKGLTVGREPLQSSLVLSNADISAKHAQLFWKEDAFWVMSLHAENDLWVNYNRIGTQPVRLQSGDLIHFATVGFRFKMLGSADSSHLRIEPYQPQL